MEVFERIAIPCKASHSPMHSFGKGFSIVMCSRSQRVKLKEKKTHRCVVIRLVVPKWMCGILHVGTYHSGGKSRHLHTEGMRLLDLCGQRKRKRTNSRRSED